MPCDSSHCAPLSEETESSKVRELLREVAGQPFNHQKRHEYYGNVKTLDKDTATLCEACKNLDVSKYSLELQLWWRDHQKADAEKDRQTDVQRIRAALQRSGLSKLNIAERVALGLD